MKPSTPTRAIAFDLVPLTATRDVNLRATPSISADVITGLKQGSEVTILERQGNWDHVEVVISGSEERQGWAYGSYLTPQTDPAVKP